MTGTFGGSNLTLAAFCTPPVTPPVGVRIMLARFGWTVPPPFQSADLCPDSSASGGVEFCSENTIEISFFSDTFTHTKYAVNKKRPNKHRVTHHLIAIIITCFVRFMELIRYSMIVFYKL